MRIWASVAALCVGCAHVRLAEPSVRSCVGEYRWSAIWYDSDDQDGMSAYLALDEDGTYLYRSNLLHPETQTDDRFEGRWLAVPGGVRLRGGPPDGDRLVLVGDGGHVYLLNFKTMRAACSRAELPSLDLELERPANDDEPKLPIFQEVCAGM